MSTNCVLVELKKLKDQVHPDAAKVCRELEMRKCNHYPPQAPSDCIKGILGGENKHRYAIATNDKELRQEVAKIPGVPLVYINKSVVILEPPSVATLKRSKELELKKLIPKGSLLNVEKKVEPIRRFKKRPSAPNPLSVKKKKKPTEIERGNVMRDVEKLRQEMDSEPRKRQRKH